MSTPLWNKQRLKKRKHGRGRCWVKAGVSHKTNPTPQNVLNDRARDAYARSKKRELKEERRAEQAKAYAAEHRKPKHNASRLRQKAHSSTNRDPVWSGTPRWQRPSIDNGDW